MAVRRIAKPSARELFKNKHMSLNIEDQAMKLCACIRMADHEEKDTIYAS